MSRKSIFVLVGFLSLGVALSYASSPDLREVVGVNNIAMPPRPEIENIFVPNSKEVSEVPREGKEVASISSICIGIDSGNFDCYEGHYIRLVKDKGISGAFADLKERYETDNYVRSQCHPLTHVIGREAALKFKTPSEAYAVGDSYCWSGYYHGVLETHVERTGVENLPKEMDRLCDRVAGKERYSFDYYNCVHGLGHGVMAITNTELFKSLEYCDMLSGQWEQDSCAGGVYMENIIVDNINHVTRYLDPKRPLYPCTDSPERHKNTCYLMQTSYVLKVNGGDFEDTFAWCRKTEEPYRATCLQSLGRDASGRTTSNATTTKKLCLMGKDYFEQSNCVIGAVKDFISYFRSDSQARVLCSSFEDKQLADLCLQTGTSYHAQL
jgi:hypothetical protein